MATKLTKEQFQEKLNKEATLRYTVVGDYISGSKPITVIHNECGKEIKQNYAKNLFRVKSCPHCEPKYHKDTEEQVKERLNKHNIRLLSTYKHEKEKVKLLYPCGCTHFKTLSQIKAGSGTTCLTCTHRVKNLVITLDEVNQRLKNSTYGSYSIVGEYRGTSNPTDIKCNDCGHIHKAVKPMHIERRVQGC